MLTAHILFPALDTINAATASPHKSCTELLRRRMGFDGLIITDAMDMHAINQMGTYASVRAALEAGIDLVLLGHLPDQIALGRTLLPIETMASVARIEQARQKLPRDLLPLDVVGCPEHRAIAQAIADASITRVRAAGRLPLRPSAEAEIAVITAQPVDLTPADTSSSATIRLAEAIRARHLRTTDYEINYNAPASEVSTLVSAVAAADTVIVGTICADQDASQAALVRELQRAGKQPIVVALRTPYDLRAFPEIETYLCAYSIRAVTTEAVARVLFGEIEARGVLPCSIPGIAGSAEMLPA